jgi:hypothetical protein
MYQRSRQRRYGGYDALGRLVYARERFGVAWRGHGEECFPAGQRYRQIRRWIAFRQPSREGGGRQDQQGIARGHQAGSGVVEMRIFPVRRMELRQLSQHSQYYRRQTPGWSRRGLRKRSPMPVAKA